MPATRDASEVQQRAVDLLDRTEAATRPVRLLGVSLHGLAAHPGDEAPRGRADAPRLPFETAALDDSPSA